MPRSAAPAMAFIGGISLPLRRAHAPLRPPRRVRRAFLPLRCAASPPSGAAEPGAAPPGDGSDWLDMARSMGVDGGEGEEGAAEPERGEPEWLFPAGEDFSGEGGGEEEGEGAGAGGAWGRWNRAVEMSEREEVVERKPEEEMEFWRGTARELGTGNGVGRDGAGDVGEVVEVVGDARGDAGGDAVGDDPTQIWGAASSVTASVADLQEQLREEIESFDPLQESDNYRDIARELVGPGSDIAAANASIIKSPLEDRTASPPETAGDVDAALRPEGEEEDDASGAEPGTGWNPDVDWMRFDDVGRELQKKKDAEQRAEARGDAERKRRDASDGMPEFEYSPSPEGDAARAEVPRPEANAGEMYTDENGRVLSAEEVAAALAGGAVVVDQREGRGDSAQAAQSDSTPAESGGAAGTQAPRREASANETYTDENGRVLSAEEVAAALEGGAVVVDEGGGEVPLSEEFGRSVGRAAASSASPAGASSNEIGGSGGGAGDIDWGAPLSSAESVSTPSGGFSSTPTQTSAYQGGSDSSFAGKRMSTGRTYGPDADPEDLQWLKKKGFDLRDPEEETKFWRDAAREVGIVSPAEGDAGDEVSTDEESEAPLGTASEPPVVDAAESAPSVPVAESAPGFSKASIDDEDEVDAGSAWTLWNSGRESWADAVEKAPPRDAQAEVDMWRSTARDVVPGAGGDTAGSAASGSGGNDDGKEGGTEERSSWSAWNSANDSWQREIDAVGDFGVEDNTSQWRSSAQEMGASSDADAKSIPDRSWGQGAPAQGNSSGQAWSSWQSSGTGVDFVKNQRAPTRRNVDEIWGNAARDMVADGEASRLEGVDGEVEASVNSGGGGDGVEEGVSESSNVNFWRAAAKDVGVPSADDEADEADVEAGEAEAGVADDKGDGSTRATTS